MFTDILEYIASLYKGARFDMIGNTIQLYNFSARVSRPVLSVSEIYQKLFINLEFTLRAVEAVAHEECPAAEGSLEE